MQHWEPEKVREIRSEYRFRILIAGSAILCASATAGHIFLNDSPHRPIWMFVGIGASLSLLFFATVTIRSINSFEAVSIGGLGLLNGIGIRVTGYSSVVVSGIDHGRWLMRVEDMISANSITEADMYAAAPFYLLELMIGKLIAGLHLTQTRFVTILIASVLPLALYVLAFRVTKSRRVSLATLLFAAAQMLFLRTSALLEAESIAIVWAVFALFTFTHFVQTGDQRSFYSFMALMLLAVFVHFLYATVIFCIGAGTQLLLFVLSRARGDPHNLSQIKIKKLLAANVIVGLLIPLYILTSTYAGEARDVIRSAVDQPHGQPPPNPGPSDGGTGGVSTSTPSRITHTEPSDSPPIDTPSVSPGSSPEKSPPNSLKDLVSDVLTSLTEALSTFIPKSGAAGRSVGFGNWTSTSALTGTFSPLLAFLAFSAIGGLVSLKRRRIGDLILIASGITTVVVTVAAVVVELEFRLGFRLYYFTAAILVVFAAIGSIRISRNTSYSRGALTVLVVVCFFSYATIGPMSPLGNNVDPRFGGTAWYLTADEYDQLPTYGDVFDEGEWIDNEVPDTPKHLRLASNNDDLYLTRDTCERDGVVMTTGALRVCQRANTG